MVTIPTIGVISSQAPKYPLAGVYGEGPEIERLSGDRFSCVVAYDTIRPLRKEGDPMGDGRTVSPPVGKQDGTYQQRRDSERPPAGLCLV
jgi:hypothetical protein